MVDFTSPTPHQNMTITVKGYDLHVNGYDLHVLRDALKDYRKTWESYLRDCDEGKRPNMDPVGAKMILKDIEGLIERLSD